MIKQACALALLSFCLGAQAQTLGENLIVNGDAESGITGWTIFDGYSPIQSVAYGDNWVKPTQPGPVDRGLDVVFHPSVRDPRRQSGIAAGVGDVDQPRAGNRQDLDMRENKGSDLREAFRL